LRLKTGRKVWFSLISCGLQVDPEMMSFDKDRNLLIVSGAVTGTLGVYEVHGLPTCKTAPAVTLKLTDNLKLPKSYAGNVVRHKGLA
jgi:hypothetical protein